MSTAIVDIVTVLSATHCAAIAAIRGAIIVKSRHTVVAIPICVIVRDLHMKANPRYSEKHLMYLAIGLAAILLIAVLFASGCAARYSSDSHPCEIDGCWTYSQTRLGPAYCRKENGTETCVPVR